MILENGSCVKPKNLATLNGCVPVDPVNGIIKWHLDESILPATIDKYQLLMAFQKSFEILSEPFLPIRFESTKVMAEAPIVIKFRSGNEPDIPSGFSPGVLAYAFGNMQNFIYSSDVFFNIGHMWADMHKPGYFDLKKVCVHETLHALGFDHSDDIKDIMYWQYQSNDEINFTDDTRAAIKRFYGLQMPYDTRLVKDWLNTINNYAKVGEAELVRLAGLCGLRLNTTETKKENFDKLKAYLNK